VTATFKNWKGGGVLARVPKRKKIIHVKKKRRLATRWNQKANNFVVV